MYLLFDIGGTNLRIANSEGESLTNFGNFDTPKNFDEIFSMLLPYKGKKFEAVIAGIAGVLSKDKSTLVRSPNLSGWIDKPIKMKLQEFFGAEVYIENDAALAGLGEACFGAGRDKNIIAYMTISTGIGGARIVKKDIDASTWGFEPGQQIVDSDLTIWADSENFNSEYMTTGSVESYISGAALSARYGKHPYEIKDVSIWDEVEKLLASSLNNVTALWSPEVIVLGGGLILEGAISISKVNRNLSSIFKAFPEFPEIKKAELGDKSGLYGCVKTIDKLKL